MDELKRYLDRVCRSLGGSASLREHVREELREHLLDAVEQHRAEGISREEAARRAIEEFGSPEAVKNDLQAVHGRRLMPLVVAKAMEWKERTMKTGWKWSFVAHLTLAAVIALQLLLLWLYVVMLVPGLKDGYERFALPVPQYVETLIGLSRLVGNSSFHWFPLSVLATVAAAWGIFERKCRSENKRTIRLTAGLLLALATMMFSTVTVLAATIPVWSLVHEASVRHPEEGAARLFSQASAAYGRFEQAVEAEQWEAARRAAGDLGGIIGAFESDGTAAVALAGLHRREDFTEMRLLVQELMNLVRDVHVSMRGGPLAWEAGERPFRGTPEHLDELRKSWQEFEQRVNEGP